jgi:hypothetical protein
MASFHIRLTLKTAATILALGGAAAPFAGFTQPAFEPLASTDREQQVVEKIHELQAQDGPYSAASIEPWTALSLVYEEEGLSAFAIGAIEQARHAVRVNYGLYSLEEAPLLRRAVRIEDARGNIEAAMDLEQSLLSIANRHPDDVRSAPILRDIGDRRLDVLRRYLSGEMPPEITLGCYYRGGPRPLASEGCLGGSRRVAIQSLSAEAWSYYREAVGVMARNGLYSSKELRDMERQLIRISYSSSRYNGGKQSYQRLISYNAATSAPWLTRIETFVEMTDWDLLFSQRSGTRALDDALEGYEKSYALLEKKGIPRESISGLFAPEIPIVLPSFLANPLASEDSGSGRYIDIAFDITKYGRSEHVDVLDTTNATDAEKGDLVHFIKRSLFRPRLRDGRVADSSRVVVRRYLPRAHAGEGAFSDTALGDRPSAIAPFADSVPRR